MKDKVIELLNSNNLDDIVLGILIMLEEDLWESISRKSTKSWNLREYYTICKENSHQLIITSSRLFEIGDNTIWELNPDESDYIPDVLGRGLTIFYTDKSITF